MAKSFYRHRRFYRALINCARWRHLRRAYLSEHPLCETCAARGLAVPATELHHVRPVESGITEKEQRQLCYSPANLRALCHDCHVKVHRDLRSHDRATVTERKEREISDALHRMFIDIPGG